MTANQDEVDKVQRIIDHIFASVPEEEEKIEMFYESCSLAMIRLKILARDLYAKLDENRKSLESKKASIDKLQLAYENVLYRKAHLKREIQNCKDLATHNTNDIEKETGETLGITTYSEDLDEVKNKTMDFLTTEKERRIALKRRLDTLQEEKQALVDKLEKKRKFLDEVPRKVEVIKAAALDLKTFLE